LLLLLAGFKLVTATVVCLLLLQTTSEKRYFDVLTRFTAAKQAESKP